MAVQLWEHEPLAMCWAIGGLGAGRGLLAARGSCVAGYVANKFGPETVEAAVAEESPSLLLEDENGGKWPGPSMG